MSIITHEIALGSALLSNSGNVSLYLEADEMKSLAIGERISNNYTTAALIGQYQHKHAIHRFPSDMCR